MRIGKRFSIALMLSLSFLFAAVSPLSHQIATAEPTNDTTTNTANPTEPSTTTVAAPDQNQTNSTDQSSGGAGDEDKCLTGLMGFGWLFCPGQTIVTGLVNMASGWISSGLKWTFMASEESTKLFEIWQKFQHLAYIVLAISFVVMIYSIATNNLLSNYTIRKMLPMVIIVSILVTLSYYICALLVDLSNIAGQYIYTLIADQMGGGEHTIRNAASHIANGVINIGLLAVAIFFFGGTTFLGLVVILIAIVFRQILLVVLVIASPIILSLYLLPNTKKWAAGWMDFFGKLLLVYPIFSAIWAASRLIANTFGVMDASPVPGFIIDFICAIAPLMAIIPVFKMAGGVLKSTVSQVQGDNRAKKVRDWIDKKPTAAVRESNLGANARSWGSNAALGMQNKLGSKTGMWQPIASVLRSPSFNRLTTHAADQANKLDEENQKSATNWVKNNLTDTQRTEIIKNAGAYTNNAGKRVVLTDTHKIRAAIAEGKKALSTSDWLDALDNFDKLEDSLNKAGRGREADQIRQAYAAAMKKDGKDDKRVFPFSTADIAAFGRGDSDWRNTATNPHIARERRNVALINAAANMDSDSLESIKPQAMVNIQNRITGMQNNVLAGTQGAPSEAMYNRAVQNIRQMSTDYTQNNPTAMTSSNPTEANKARGLYNGQFLRTTSEHQAYLDGKDPKQGVGIDLDKLSKQFNDAIVNSDNKAFIKATTDANTLKTRALHSGTFNNLSAIDQNRLTNMASFHQTVQGLQPNQITVPTINSRVPAVTTLWNP